MEVDLYTQIQHAKFQTKLPYPHKPTRPLLQSKHNSAQAEVYVEALKAYEEALVEYGKAIALYREDQRKLDAEFKQAAFKYCGIEDHPKRERAWSMAWEHGHSSGLNDVLHHLEELSELLI